VVENGRTWLPSAKRTPDAKRTSRLTAADNGISGAVLDRSSDGNRDGNDGSRQRPKTAIDSLLLSQI
jgi:hypothetical protein